MRDGVFTIEPCLSSPSWPWLAEVTRSSCCQLYALGGGEGTQRSPHHSNEIISEVRRRLGSVELFSPQKEVIRTIFGLLILLEDFAHIRRATYLPRETRVLLLSPNYGRVAGGLPLEFADYDNHGVAVHEAETLGRIVRIAPHDEPTSGRAVGESYTWGSMSVSERISSLLATAGKETRPSADESFFYNPTMPRSLFRGRRWQRTSVGADYSIARREGKPPYAYFLIIGSDTRGGGTWLDISYDDAKRWLTVADEMAGTTHAVKTERIGDDVVIGLPMNLPDFCTEALMSAANCVRQEGPLRYFRIHGSLSPLIDYVCRIAALSPYE